MFTVRLASDHNLISNRVGVDESRGIFSSVVLKDELLLAFLDVLPISLERDIEDGVTSDAPSAMALTETMV